MCSETSKDSKRQKLNAITFFLLVESAYFPYSMNKTNHPISSMNNVCVVSRLKVIIFGAHIAYNHAWVISSYCHVGSGKYFKQLWSMTQVCAITLTQGHSSKLKVTMHTYPKSVCWPQLLNAILDRDMYTIVVIDPRVSNDLD